MFDGVYQAVMCFFIPYLAIIGNPFVTHNGLDVSDKLRFGAIIAHPAVITINMYILINTYRWDWIMLLVVVLSDLFVFFWTGVYTTTTYSQYFYEAAPQIYQEPSFWCILFLVPVMCLFPRYAIKALQKVYWPYDVDIIREQVQQGKFQRLGPVPVDKSLEKPLEGSTTGSSESSRKAKHVQYGSVDEDRRPIYPPSVATHTHTQSGSDGTNYTNHRPSTDMPMAGPSTTLQHRTRPSYDRMRASMDRVRPSYEASNDFTTAARLTRLESSHSVQRQREREREQQRPPTSSRFMGGRLRGLSIISTKSKHDKHHHS